MARLSNVTGGTRSWHGRKEVGGKEKVCSRGEGAMAGSRWVAGVLTMGPGSTGSWEC